MNRYEARTPRLAFAVIALVLSGTTMAAMVGAPAATCCDPAWLASRKPAVEVAISPSHIDVVAKREAVKVAQLSAPHVD
jgi:hypothetical protein